jgi:hypothetical protein
MNPFIICWVIVKIYYGPFDAGEHFFAYLKTSSHSPEDTLRHTYGG